MSQFDREEFLKSRIQPKAYEGGTQAERISEADEEQYPRLHAMLTTTVLDGKPRKTTTILLFCEAGRLKACLNDRAEGLSGFLTLDGLELVAEQLEEGLAKEDVDWRAAKRR